MAVPFSNTHLRVPRGFGNILEGLAREVLRDQPADIPEYAARYFDALLKQREESGIAPAEWAAKLEDIFYNDQEFKISETDHEKEPTAGDTSSQEEASESQAEELGTAAGDEGGDKQAPAVVDPELVNPDEEENKGAAEPVERGSVEVEDIKTELEPPSGETHESDSDGSALPKQGSLVEINFEDVPEAQQIEKQPEEVSSAPVVQTETTEIEQKEEPKELVASAVDRDASDAQKYQDFDSEDANKVDCEGKKVESLEDSTDLTEVTNDSSESGINHEKSSLSDQPTAESEKEKQAVESVPENEDNEMVNEGKFHCDEDSVKEAGCELEEDEKADVLEADGEETHKEGHSEMGDEEINDGEAGNNSSQVTHSSTSVAPAEPESEMFETSAQDLTKEGEESERTLGESQPEDTEEEKEATSKEEQKVTQKAGDFEVQEESDTTQAEESVGAADQPEDEVL
ncbi:unnamed protein product [Ophioblennius macclurei]